MQLLLKAFCTGFRGEFMGPSGQMFEAADVDRNDLAVSLLCSQGK